MYVGIIFAYMLPHLRVYDHVLKKLNFDLLTPPPGLGEGEGVCGQNICYHVDVFMIPFNLICNMTLF